MALYRDWSEFLEKQATEPYFAELLRFLAEERAAGPVYPTPERVYRAFESPPLREVKVVVIGQDPYHGPGEACGLVFSVEPRTKKPPSLVNILEELYLDLNEEGCAIGAPRMGLHAWFQRQDGDLSNWAQQGVLLLNRALTVRHKTPGSHLRQWEQFTDAAIEAVIHSSKYSPHFINWGKPAQEAFERVAYRDGRHVEILAPGIGRVNHVTFTNSAHPSPLSAKRGFFGSRPFSKANTALRLRHALRPDTDIPQIDWRLR